MKKKSKIQKTLDAIGNGAREAYLQMNPHGYSAVNKIHKNNKKYNRKNNSRCWEG